MRTCKKCGVEKPESDFYESYTRKRTLSQCKECVKKSVKECAERNSEKRKTYRKEYWKNNRVRLRNYRLLKVYGISQEAYEEIYQSQSGLCAICKKPFDVLAVDHCHETGQVRGLLCTFCNTALGGFFDSILALESAIDYLKKSGK